MSTQIHAGYGQHSRSIPLTDKLYMELIENAANYNSKLHHETRMRLPFLDSQTGVAQKHTGLWQPYRNRCPGRVPGELYSYPARRWKKKKRTYSGADVKLSKAGEVETGESDMHQISAVENPAAQLEEEFPSVEFMPKMVQMPEERWYDEYDQLSEPLDAGEIDDRNSEDSDFEEQLVKKKKKTPKKKGPGRGRKAPTGDKEVDEKEKPYSCDLCGARYKTRPGLTYHVTHVHKAPEVEEEEEEEELPPPPPPPPPKPAPTENMDEKANKADPNNYCDFCLGDNTENKKTGVQEDMVSCADCGRSGHPTCLQFTDNMIISVKKYPWQCIECKSCGLCGTSDNDDQLLFCDDCDRGYHMYCLNPPLSAPPEGSWSCHLCIDEFYGGKKPDNGQ